MTKLINFLIGLVIGGLVFYVIEFLLVPMLKNPIHDIVSVIVIIIGIVYLLSLLVEGVKWPWIQK